MQIKILWLPMDQLAMPSTFHPCAYSVHECVRSACDTMIAHCHGHPGSSCPMCLRDLSGYPRVSSLPVYAYVMVLVVPCVLGTSGDTPESPHCHEPQIPGPSCPVCIKDITGTWPSETIFSSLIYICSSHRDNVPYK